MTTRPTETETRDNCGRAFVCTADGPDLNEVLCPWCDGNRGPVTESDFQDFLADLLETAEDTPVHCEAETFAAAGVLTTNKGLVVRTPNGAEFQITIVRSR